MIGRLPNTLTVNNIERAIRSDYRVALAIFIAFDDVDLTENERFEVMLKNLYVNAEEIPYEDLQEALKQGIWFLDGGGTLTDKKPSKHKIIDWEQDEPIIFSAINKVAGKEVRELPYMHWWTFLGLFQETGEGVLQSVLNIRQKKSKGKKLEKYESEYYREHKELVDIKKKHTEEEQEEIDYLNDLLDN